jgi:hypothetical protein
MRDCIAKSSLEVSAALGIFENDRSFGICTFFISRPFAFLEIGVYESIRRTLKFSKITGSLCSIMCSRSLIIYCQLDSTFPSKSFHSVAVRFVMTGQSSQSPEDDRS